MQSPSSKIYRTFSLATIILMTFVTTARGAGLELYPTDLGTAHAGQAAIAQDASTAASNPAGMTLLDRSQLMTSPGALLPSTNFDVAPETTTKGGGGGNAGVFFPYGGFFYVHKLSEKLRLGVAVDSDFGLSGDYGKTWVGRYYLTYESIITGTINPSIAYEVNDWLSVGAGFSFSVGRLPFSRRSTTFFRACRTAASRSSRGTKHSAVTSAYLLQADRQTPRRTHLSVAGRLQVRLSAAPHRSRSGSRSSSQENRRSEGQYSDGSAATGDVERALRRHTLTSA